MPQRDQLK